MRSLTNFAAARMAALTVAAVAFTAPLSADKPPVSAVPSSPDDRTIVHVLNRVTFGARPEDIERVRAMGLQAFIDQQLHSERVPDPAISARLEGFETLRLSPRKLADEYFIPAQEARKDAQKAAGKDGTDADKPMRTPEQMEAARKQRIVIEELSAQKVLRAAYSERQLEEVMTDFWFNHFNVFAGKGAT